MASDFLFIGVILYGMIGFFVSDCLVRCTVETMFSSMPKQLLVWAFWPIALVVYRLAKGKSDE